ncbi:MAG: hypothetical protein L0922_02150, partial [Candidatus Mariimomonas ferrooxydans]
MEDTGEGSGANIIQAIFYPVTPELQVGGIFDRKIAWIGRLTNFWYYIDPFFANSSIREETDGLEGDGSYILDLENDYIINFYFDAVNELTKASRCSDDDGDGDCDTPQSDVNLENVLNLWEAGKLLWERDISDPLLERKIYTPLDTGLLLTDNANKFDAADNTKIDALRPLLNTDNVLRDDDQNRAVATNIIEYIHGEEVPDYSDAWGIENYRSRMVAIDFDGISANGAELGPYVWKLGDVLNSTPRISSWIQLNTYDDRYNDATYTSYIESIGDYCSTNTDTSCTVDADCPDFATGETCETSNTDYKGRGMVFAGANDGQLHAFNLGKLELDWSGQGPLEHARLSGTDLGKEVWSFIPKNALPYLKYFKEPGYCHVYSVDLAPYLFDASIGTTGPAVAGCTDANYDDCFKTGVADPSDRWRTILIGGMRLGGACKNISTACTEDLNGDGIIDSTDCVNTPVADLGYSSYFALDITDQNNPELLWEFYDENLGFTTTGPAVVRIGDNPNKNGKWFVVFGSGPTGPIDTVRQQFLGRSDQNLKLFIFDLKSGPGANNADVTVKDTTITNAFAGSMLNATQDTDLDYQDDVLYIPFVTKCTATTAYCTVDTWTNGGFGRLLTKEDPTPGNWEWSKVMENIGPLTSSVTRLQHKTKGLLWLYFGTGRYFYEL